MWGAIILGIFSLVALAIEIFITLRRPSMPTVGDMVLYTDEFDADTSYSPNVSPAIVNKVNANGTVDLIAFFMNGFFYKTNVPQGQPGVRSTWSPKT